jgi:hypothetical protein
MSKYDLANIVSLYESGMSCREIGKSYGVTGASIHGFLKKNGVQTRSRSSAAKQRDFGDSFCDGCGEVFQKQSVRHKLCSGCIPSRKWYLRWQKYGITKKDYDQILEKQNGVCPLCLNIIVEEDAVVDHCHKTGIVRGILCNADNLALHRFEDADFVSRTFRYLKMGES